jgi:hypothetical protein
VRKNVNLERAARMNVNHRFRTSSVVIVAIVAIGFSAPVMAQTAAQDIELAPVSGPTWDESSGYGSVEAVRASLAIPTDIARPGTVDPVRVNRALDALHSGDLGSVQEDTLAAIVAAAIAWDDVSGYGSVEAIRATYAFPGAVDSLSSQVPSDVRWAPATTSGDLSAALISGQRAESAHLATLPLSN